MYTLKNITKHYPGKKGLDHVSLEIGDKLNFIVGHSGSGKSTLLKIIGGLDTEYEGEAFLQNKELKTLSDEERSSLLNQTIGFIWQENTLLNHLTVYENIQVPHFLGSMPSEKSIDKVLKRLGLESFKNSLVKNLSGGQQKRVAIARELMKDSKIIIADEPSSSLDKENAKQIMKELRKLAQSRCVIIVTHDESLIEKHDTVIKLHKGQVESQTNAGESRNGKSIIFNKLKMKTRNSLALATLSMKRTWSRVAMSSMVVLLASLLIMASLGQSVGASNQQEFDKLLNTYGETLLDIGLYSSFFNAGGTDGESNDKPSGEVNQDISKLYDTLATDDRIEFIANLKPFDDIKINLDGKSYDIANTGNTPIIGHLLAGKMPSKDNEGIAVPKSFVKQANLKIEDAIGKEIVFNAQVGRWINDEFFQSPTEVTVRIVAVIDTNISFDETTKFEVTDSFLFSPDTLKEVLEQGKTDISSASIYLRSKSPEAMISLKDDLQRDGIVPIGRFELVEDYVRLGNQSADQSSSANIIIAGLGFLGTIAISILNSVLKRKENVVLMINGFQKKHLVRQSLIENLLQAILISVFFFIIHKPLNSLITSSFNISLQVSIYAIPFLLASIMFFISILFVNQTKLTKQIQAGSH